MLALLTEVAGEVAGVADEAVGMGSTPELNAELLMHVDRVRVSPGSCPH